MLPFKAGDKRSASTEPNAALMERLRIGHVIQAQFEVFRRYYPEHVDRNQVKYPIDDKLLT
jgi:hypothetical protein